MNNSVPEKVEEIKYIPVKTLSNNYAAVDFRYKNKNQVYPDQFSGHTLYPNDSQKESYINHTQDGQNSALPFSQQQIIPQQSLPQQMSLQPPQIIPQMIIPHQTFFEIKQNVNSSTYLPSYNQNTLPESQVGNPEKLFSDVRPNLAPMETYNNGDNERYLRFSPESDFTYLLQNSMVSGKPDSYVPDRLSGKNYDFAPMSDGSSLYTSQFKIPEILINSTGSNSHSMLNYLEEFNTTMGNEKKSMNIFKKRDQLNMYGRNKRSRMGCLTCRRRKKRCCEQRPTCSECARLELKCSWPIPGTENKNKSKSNSLVKDELINSPFGKIKIIRGVISKK